MSGQEMFTTENTEGTELGWLDQELAFEWMPQTTNGVILSAGVRGLHAGVEGPLS